MKRICFIILNHLKKINRIDKSEHWPQSIKSIIECFPFLDIMDTSLTISLLKMFSMFSAIFTVRDDTVKKVALMCINCKRKTYIQHKSDKKFCDKIITPL